MPTELLTNDRVATSVPLAIPPQLRMGSDFPRRKPLKPFPAKVVDLLEELRSPQPRSRKNPTEYLGRKASGTCPAGWIDPGHELQYRTSSTGVRNFHQHVELIENATAKCNTNSAFSPNRWGIFPSRSVFQTTSEVALEKRFSFTLVGGAQDGGRWAKAPRPGGI
jgi:hypothetical protein